MAKARSKPPGYQGGENTTPVQGAGPTLIHERTIKPSELKAIAKKALSPSDGTTSDIETNEAEAVFWDRLGADFEAIETDSEGNPVDLPALAAEYISWTEQENQAKKRKAQIRALLEPRLIQAKENNVRGDFFLVNRYQSHHPKSIDGLMLLENGVHQDTIDASTVGGDSYWTMTIRKAVAR